MRQIIFLGNGALAKAALGVLTKHFEVVFQAHSQADLSEVARIKQAQPEVPAVLASFGVIIRQDLLDLFEETGGIVNIHPSLLPKYRGPSPIESAILNGDEKFGVSIMKLAAAMDAGPVYYQAEIAGQKDGRDLTKFELYDILGIMGAEWLSERLFDLPKPKPQDDAQATYCQKLSREMSALKPGEKSAKQLYNEVRALAGWPKSTYVFYGKECIVHAAHVAGGTDAKGDADVVGDVNAAGAGAVGRATEIADRGELALKCADGKYLVVDQLQPTGKRVMEAQAFLNGYGRR